MKKTTLCLCLLSISLIGFGQTKQQLFSIEAQLANYEISAAEKNISTLLTKRPNKRRGQLLFLQAQLLQLQGDYTAAFDLAEKAKKQTKANRQAQIIAFQGALLTDLDDYQKAAILLKEAYKINAQKKKPDVLTTAQIYYHLGLLRIDQKKYVEADSLYHIAQLLLEQEKQEKSIPYVRLLYRKGESYLEQNKLEQAEQYLNDALAQLAQFCSEEDVEYGFIWNQLGRLWQRRGKPEKALSYFDKALEKQLTVFGKQHLYFARTLKNKGLFYLNSGEYAKAETILLTLKSNLAAYLGKTVNYGHTLSLLGQVYREMGKKQAAISVYQEAKDLFEKLDDIAGYSNVLNELAVIYNDNNQFQTSIDLLEEGRKFLSNKKQDKSENYMAILINLGLNYVDLNQPNKAKSILNEAKNLVYEILGEEHYYYATVTNNLARSYENTHQYDDAKRLYLETERIDKIVLGEKHPYFMSTLANTANVYALLNEKNKAYDYYKRLIKGQTNLIFNYYSTFEEATRLSYLKESTEYFDEFFSFVVRQDTITHQAYADMQNISLSTKSLALDFSVDNKIQIDSLQDAANHTLLTEWTALRTKLSQAYTMSEKERVNANFDLKKMEEETILLEKQLVRGNEGMAQQLSRQTLVQFSEMQATLLPKEAALDFIKFHYYTPQGKTDSIFYGALITKPSEEVPHFVYLAEEKQLARMLKAKIRANGGNYIANSTISHDLYQLIWQPIEPYLAEVENIKLSPTGLLHKVSFAALATDANGQNLLMNQYRFDYYSNMRDLAKQPKKGGSTLKSIALVGGANFDLDSLSLLELSNISSLASPQKKEVLLSSTSSSADTQAEDAEVSRGTVRFNYLAGTAEEVKSIEQQLVTHGWQTQTLTDQFALEDQVKLLSGQDAPAVLHIATHGYFFATAKKSGAKISTLRDRIRASKNPLIRSGLVFTGVNHAWKGGGRIANMDDGVLTAFEISNLDLFNTDLVVLSACETGLGDIYDTEGVFGLQRAFKMAGAKQLITSLWKVPDRQTMELMNLFYQHYLESQDAAQALFKAQSILSQQYSPYYWAAFVLVQ